MASPKRFGLGEQLLRRRPPSSPSNCISTAPALGARDRVEARSSGDHAVTIRTATSSGPGPTRASSTHARVGRTERVGRAAGNPAIAPPRRAATSRPRSPRVATFVGSAVGRPGSTSTATAPSSITRRAASATPASASRAAAITSSVRRRLGSESRGATSDGDARCVADRRSARRSPHRAWAARRVGRRARRGVRRAARRSASRAAVRSSLVHLRERRGRSPARVRSRTSARDSRDFTVPGRTSSASAVSASLISNRYR